MTDGRGRGMGRTAAQPVTVARLFDRSPRRLLFARYSLPPPPPTVPPIASPSHPRLASFLLLRIIHFVSRVTTALNSLRSANNC